MFKVTGKIMRLASVTNLLLTYANPQSNSTPLANGIKSPVVTGSGTNFKKKLIEANNNNNPIKVLIIKVAIFISLVD